MICKIWLLIAGGAATAFVLLAAAPARVGLALAETAIDARAGTDATKELPDGLSVTLCGTGSPMADPTRAGPCNVVIAG